MDKETNEPVQKKVNAEYIVYSVLVLVFALGAAFARKLFEATEAKEIFHILSDCLCMPGVFMTGFALLMWVAALGTFDAMGYMFSRFSLHVFLPTPKAYQKADTLYEYKQQKNKKGRKWSPPMLIVGSITLGLSFIFMLVYQAM